MWYGWLWTRNGWEHVCEAGSIGRCSQILAREAEARGIRGNLKRALTGGGVPTWRPSQPPSTYKPELLELDPLT